VRVHERDAQNCVRRTRLRHDDTFVTMPDDTMTMSHVYDVLSFVDDDMFEQHRDDVAEHDADVAA